MVSIQQGLVAIVGVMVAVILFGALMPLVVDTIDSADTSGTTYTLLSNLPLFLVLGIVIGIIVAAVGYIKSSD